MDIIERIDSEIEKRSLLKHPFYQMWSEGKLTIDHLQGYSKEYFQLVKAIPGIVGNIASASPATNDDISGNGREEAEHVALWIRFAGALGVKAADLEDYVAYPKTRAAVEAMRRLSASSFEEAVAAMYAYEAELPKISRTKVEGLKKYYGMESKEATEYFEIHEEVDVRHAQVWRDILRQIPEEKRDAAVAAAIRSLDAQNLLLDSVHEKYVGTNC